MYPKLAPAPFDLVNRSPLIAEIRFMQRLTDLTEQLVTNATGVDVADLRSLTELHYQLRAVADKAGGAERLLHQIITGSVENASDVLLEVSQTITELRDIVRRTVNDSVGVTLVDDVESVDLTNPLDQTDL